MRCVGSTQDGMWNFLESHHHHPTLLLVCRGVLPIFRASVACIRERSLQVGTFASLGAALAPPHLFWCGDDMFVVVIVIVVVFQGISHESIHTIGMRSTALEFGVSVCASHVGSITTTTTTTPISSDTISVPFCREGEARRWWW